jgi:hypothetical protein
MQQPHAVVRRFSQAQYAATAHRKAGIANVRERVKPLLCMQRKKKTRKDENGFMVISTFT